MIVHVCRVDVSKETGAVVVCTCGAALGPFAEHERALAVAREHRRLHDASRKR